MFSVCVQLELCALTISVEIEGMARRLILDTGFNVSIMQPGLSTGDVIVTLTRPYGVTGETLDIRGQQLVSFTLEGRQYRHPFLVFSLPTDAAGLLGTDFFEKTGAEINFECGQMSPTSIHCPGCIAFRPWGTRHSRYSLRVK